MAETFLVTPVPEADPLVRDVCARQNPELVLGADEVLAHITALGPFLPLGEITSDVVDALRVLFTPIPAFDFALIEVRAFKGGIVYLAPEPPEPFSAMTSRLAAEYPRTPPYGGRFKRVVPHLTVGFADGNTGESWLREQARAQVPLSCHAGEVRLIEADERMFVTRYRFPLAG